MIPPSDVGQWLYNQFVSLDLGESAEGYLYGRGVTEQLITTLGVKEWRASSIPTPSVAFAKRYGARGERLEGTVAFPILSPSGMLIGMEARTPSRDPSEKRISEFRLPEAAWSPFIFNAPEAADRMWEGGSVWVCEGVYDLCALVRVVPPTDAVVATLKAGISKTHVQFLSRFCRGTIYMVYDNDETGRRATDGYVDPATGKYRPGALGLLKKAGLRAVDYRYRGKDPGDAWTKGGATLLKSIFPIQG